FEAPLTRLIWIASMLCILTSFGMSKLLIGDLSIMKAGETTATLLPNLWWQLAVIISCGTLAAVLIPEFTKIFTSSHYNHVHFIRCWYRQPGVEVGSGLCGEESRHQGIDRVVVWV